MRFWLELCMSYCSGCHHHFHHPFAPCGLRGCKNWLTPFPGRMSYKATKPGLSFILACFIVLLFIRAFFYVLLVFVAMYSVIWLFWLSCHYLPSDWLERLLWGSLIVARGSSPESPGQRVRMVYCLASLFYYVFVLSPAPPAPVSYHPTVMARYSLFVLKVPLNPKQTNKQTIILCFNKHRLTQVHLEMAVKTERERECSVLLY